MFVYGIDDMVYTDGMSENEEYIYLIRTLNLKEWAWSTH